MDHKNLIGFLIIKELNKRQVKWAKIFPEYYFKIKYIKGIDNTNVNILSKKLKLQDNKKVKEVILRIDKDGKIKYNYLQLIIIHKALISNW